MRGILLAVTGLRSFRNGFPEWDAVAANFEVRITIEAV
jgi:hypothetical protein